MNRIVHWIAANDTLAFQFIHQKLKCRLFNFLLPKITHIGGARFTISSLLTVIIFSGTVLRFVAVKALLSLALSHIVVHIVKKIYCRERPYKKLPNLHLGTHPLKDYSFPSGHTTAVFSIAVIFALHSALFAIFLLPIATLVGFSRMYLALTFFTKYCFLFLKLLDVRSNDILHLHV